MNKSRALVFSFVALALVMPPAFGQGRPRRVGPPPSDGSTPSQTSPAKTTAQRPSAGTQTNKPVDLNRPPAPPILRVQTRIPTAIKRRQLLSKKIMDLRNMVPATLCASIRLWLACP